MSTKDFNSWRFEGLNCKSLSNKYLTMDRVSQDETKIVIRVNEENLIKTRYGYAFILDYNHVVFLKDWQVSNNYFGTEVLLQKEYFAIKEWGEHDNFSKDGDLTFEHKLMIAKEQAAYISEDGRRNIVKWSKED